MLRIASVIFTLIAVSGSSALSADPVRPSGRIVVSVKTWEGEYSTRDVPGGVEATPAEGAIHAIDIATGQASELARLGRVCDHPTASPDGQWVYFQSNATGQWRLHRCRADGGGLEDLTLAHPPGPPWVDSYGYALSRDGRQLLFTVSDGMAGRLALADADGSRPRVLFPDFGYVYMGQLSPDRTRVVASGPAQGYRLLIADMPDGQPRVLTPDHPDSYAPQFTPDGQTVVFCRRDGDVYRIDAAGGNPQRLTEGNSYVEFRLSAQDLHGSTDGPQVSPDGRRIAYVAVRDGVPNVWVMNLDGSDQKQVTHHQSPSGRPRWSPDGAALGYVSFVGRYPQLFVVPTDGGEARQVSDFDGAATLFNWMP
jgi:Tol biopolymer transport system component